MAAKKIQRKRAPVKRKKKNSAPVKPIVGAVAPVPYVIPADASVKPPAEGDTTQFLRREVERQDG